MIQRKQTIFLLLALIASVVCLCVSIGTFDVDGLHTVREYNLWLVDAEGQHRFDCWPLFAILLPSSALSCYTIFLYHNRRVQAKMCMFNIFLLIGWYIVYAVYSNVLGGASSGVSFQIEFGGALPALAIAFVFLAYKGIMADERLVRAADRIR
ncbi:MAG: DUF4293 domain-containing protein [Prevotella sp.]